MSAAVLLALAGGGLVLASQAAEAPSGPRRSTRSPASVAASRLRRAAVHSGAATKNRVAVAGSGSFRGTDDSNAELKSKLAAKAKAEFEALSLDAKRAACADLKRRYPSSPEIQALPCSNPTFQGMMAAAGVAVGSALGGPVGGALGAVVASWAGPKLEEWAEDAYDYAKEAAEDLYDNTIGSLW